jgi:hypothetical protein
MAIDPVPIQSRQALARALPRLRIAHDRGASKAIAKPFGDSAPAHQPGNKKAGLKARLFAVLNNRTS